MLRDFTLKNAKSIIQFQKYLVVGGVAFLFDFGTLYLLTEKVGISYLMSAAIAFIVGLNINYVLAKFFVFKDSKIKNIEKEYMFVAVISLTGLFLNQLFIWGLTELFGIYYLVSKIISTAIILVYNFLGRKRYIFE